MDKAKVHADLQQIANHPGIGAINPAVWQTIIQFVLALLQAFVNPAPAPTPTPTPTPNP